MGSKTVLGAVAALAAVAIAWLAFDRAVGGTARGRSERASDAAPASSGARDEVASDTTPADEPSRESLAVVVPPTDAAAPDAPPSDPLLAWLSGRVLDAQRAPIAAAEVVVSRPDASHLTRLDVEARRRPREVARAATDAAGRFAFELERGIPFDVEAIALGHGDETIPQRYAGEVLEIVLGSGFTVHGTVTRERDGAPIAGARVRVFRMGGSRERLGTTADDGTYRVTFAFDEAVLEVTPREEMGSGWIRLAPGADGEVRQDVVLADGIEVRGRVVDAASGAPIEGATVGEGWTYRRTAETDARGEYVMRGFGTQGVQELYARAPGYGQAQRASLPPADGGMMRVDFELARGRIVRGRVLDPARRPLAGAYVAAVASEDSAEGQRTDWISARTDARGRFELGGLTPALRHALVTSADGFATVVHDLPADELEHAELELDDVVLAPPSILAGTVRDEHGAFVGGMEVVLTGANRDRGRWRAGSELAPAGDWYVDSREATADAEGRFWFGALPAGDYRVRARRAGQPDGPSVAVALAESERGRRPAGRRGAGARAESERRDDFVLFYPRGEELAGRVVDERGRGLEGVYVTASLRAARGGVPADPERGRASARTDSTGSFALRGLLPGAYRLDFHPFEVPETGDDAGGPWLSTALDAETGGKALEVVLPRGASIRGRLVDPSGAALVGYTILARSPTSDATPSSATDDEGGFVIEVPAGTVWDLEVRGSWQTADWETVLHTEPGVPAPSRGLELRADPERAPR